MTPEEAQLKDFVYAPMKGRFRGGRTSGLGRLRAFEPLGRDESQKSGSQLNVE